MKNKLVLIGIGLWISAIVYLIDKFICCMPNIVYVPVVTLGIILVLVGFFKKKAK